MRAKIFTFVIIVGLMVISSCQKTSDENTPGLNIPVEELNQKIETPIKQRFGVLLIHSLGEEKTGYFLDENGSAINTFPDPYWYIALSNSPCRIYGLDRLSNTLQTKGGFQIDTLKIDGTVEESKEIILNPGLNGSQIFNLSVSTNGNWLSYLKPSGVMGMSPDGAEFLDIEIMDIKKNTGEPMKITTAGNAPRKGGAFSSDSGLLAYMDDDDHGVLQVFIYNLSTHQNLQITAFEESFLNQRADEIRFSADGSHLAFSSFEEHRSIDDGTEKFWIEGAIGVVDVRSHEVTLINLPEPFYYVRSNLWWGMDGKRLFTVLEEYDPESNLTNHYLTWINIQTGNVETMVPTQSTIAFPLDDINKIGVYAETDSLYNLNTRTLEKANFPELGTVPFQFLQPIENIDIQSCLAK